jgi:hypothetical protein
VLVYTANKAIVCKHRKNVLAVFYGLSLLFLQTYSDSLVPKRTRTSVDDYADFRLGQKKRRLGRGGASGDI